MDMSGDSGKEIQEDSILLLIGLLLSLTTSTAEREAKKERLANEKLRRTFLSCWKAVNKAILEHKKQAAALEKYLKVKEEFLRQREEWLNSSQFLSKREMKRKHGASDKLKEEQLRRALKSCRKAVKKAILEQKQLKEQPLRTTFTSWRKAAKAAAQLKKKQDREAKRKAAEAAKAAALEKQLKVKEEFLRQREEWLKNGFRKKAVKKRKR